MAVVVLAVAGLVGAGLYIRALQTRLDRHAAALESQSAEVSDLQIEVTTQKAEMEAFRRQLNLALESTEEMDLSGVRSRLGSLESQVDTVYSALEDLAGFIDEPVSASEIQRPSVCFPDDVVYWNFDGLGC